MSEFHAGQIWKINTFDGICSNPLCHKGMKYLKVISLDDSFVHFILGKESEGPFETCESKFGVEVHLFRCLELHYDPTPPRPKSRLRSIE